MWPGYQNGSHENGSGHGCKGRSKVTLVVTG